MKLVKYEAARKALALAHRVDEVKSIRDKALAMQAYAKQAKDSELIGYATEIRLRAERRAGELLTEMEKAKGASGPGRGKAGNRAGPAFTDAPTLKELGLTKMQSSRWQALAALPESKFEAKVAKHTKMAVAGATGDKEVIREARADIQAEKKERRTEREKELAAKILAFPKKAYGVIYADPPWRYEVYDEATGMDRSADNQYPTMGIQEILELKLPAADNCVLFLWATVPMLKEAFWAIDAWGFVYKSHFAWVKDKIGTGYWNRNQHELLLVATKGSIPAPTPDSLSSSVIHAPRGRHSEKPACVREMIEEMFPSLPRIELFARGKISGWDVWGKEAA